MSKSMYREGGGRFRLVSGFVLSCFEISARFTQAKIHPCDGLGEGGYHNIPSRTSYTHPMLEHKD